MVACGFELEPLEATSWRAMPPIVRPLIIGRARKSANTKGGSIDG